MESPITKEIQLSISDLVLEMKVIEKYHLRGLIDDNSFDAIERSIGKEILKLCSVRYLRPGERLVTEVKKASSGKSLRQPRIIEIPYKPRPKAQKTALNSESHK